MQRPFIPGTVHAHASTLLVMAVPVLYEMYTRAGAAVAVGVMPKRPL